LNISILELGGGLGETSHKLARMFSGEVTIVDFCNKARNLSKSFFDKKSYFMNYICDDILSFNINKKFDIVHSEGVVEHFFAKDRSKCLKQHLKFLRKGGIAIIIVPHRSWIYPLRQFILKLVSPNIPKEQGFSKQELLDRIGYSPKYKILKWISNPFDIGLCIERIH
jgi:2-polyprenyl-3-methyl-5-hydroxy-6-metoxy-1,4-benzoquinol methylase